MTNAEKYFGDEDIIDQFTYELSNYMFEKLGWYEGDVYNLKKTIECFFKSNIKPQLTEDERVILRNIDKKYKYISKSKEDTELFLRKEADDTCSYIFRGYKHLFQFIKERRRIRDRGVDEMNELYPLTIIKDRYNGVYSGGKYTAWNLEPEEIPTQIFYDDVSCYGFWLSNKILVGKGDTPQEAIMNLEKLLGDEK